MDLEDTMRTWHRYDLMTHEDGSITGATETNDNADRGYPSEYARWDVKYRSFDAMKRATGLSHTGCVGCEVTVLLDGKKI